jgi:hypothetical protein
MHLTLNNGVKSLLKISSSRLRRDCAFASVFTLFLSGSYYF